MQFLRKHSQALSLKYGKKFVKFVKRTLAVNIFKNKFYRLELTKTLTDTHTQTDTHTFDFIYIDNN